MIDKAWIQELHAYMAGALRGMNVRPEVIGGVADHVHILAELRPATVIPDMIRELKKASTFWIQGQKHVPGFGWQGGYAVLSVSPFERRELMAYIAGQESHHAKENSHDELLRILTAAEIEIEMKYFE